MSTTLFAAVLAFAPGQGVPYAPPAVLYPPPPFIEPGVEANFVVPVPGGSVPNFYPLVPAPVVIKHPEWYPHPGPAYYYANNVSPYHPVYHSVRPVMPGGPAGPAATKTLYERLGGEPAIRAVVDDFVARLAENPKVNVTRKGTPKEWNPTPENVAKLKKGLVDLIGMVTGGPQKYTGRSMKEVHAGMQITQAEFDAAGADLKATLNKFKVPAKEQDELMKIVGSTAPDIVEKKEPR
jgi:truncated hemoglobin YjbI